VWCWLLSVVIIHKDLSTAEVLCVGEYAPNVNYDPRARHENRACGHAFNRRSTGVTAAGLCHVSMGSLSLGLMTRPSPLDRAWKISLWAAGPSLPKSPQQKCLWPCGPLGPKLHQASEHRGLVGK